MRFPEQGSKLLRRVGGPAAFVALGALVVGALAMGVFSTYRTNEPYPPTLSEMVIHAVVEVTIDDGPSSDDMFPSNRLWESTVDTVLWDRGDFRLADGRPANLGLPAASRTMMVSIPPQYEVESGATYVLAVTRAFWSDPVEQERWPWQYRVGLDSTRGLIPVQGTDEDLRAEIDLVTSGGESQAEALVAVAMEIAAKLDAQINGTGPAELPRLAAIERMER